MSTSSMSETVGSERPRMRGDTPRTRRVDRHFRRAQSTVVGWPGTVTSYAAAGRCSSSSASTAALLLGLVRAPPARPCRPSRSTSEISSTVVDLDVVDARRPGRSGSAETTSARLARARRCRCRCRSATRGRPCGGAVGSRGTATPSVVQPAQPAADRRRRRPPPARSTSISTVSGHCAGDVDATSTAASASTRARIGVQVDPWPAARRRARRPAARTSSRRAACSVPSHLDALRPRAPDEKKTSQHAAGRRAATDQRPASDDVAPGRASGGRHCRRANRLRRVRGRLVDRRRSGSSVRVPLRIGRARARRSSSSTSGPTSVTSPAPRVSTRSPGRARSTSCRGARRPGRLEARPAPAAAARRRRRARR